MHAPVKFCPLKDFATRYPDWKWHAIPMHGVADEVIDYCTKTVLIDPGVDSVEWAVCHATVHLDYDDTYGLFTLEQQESARDIAELRMSGGFDLALVPMDGEPSVRL